MWSLKYSPKMEATLLAILLLIKYSTCSIISGGGTSPGGTTTGNSGVQSSYYSESIFRNLDTQLLRIGSRLDQLMLRMDHLDSRVGRVQSNGHVRFDSIETVSNFCLNFSRNFYYVYVFVCRACRQPANESTCGATNSTYSRSS